MKLSSRLAGLVSAAVLYAVAGSAAAEAVRVGYLPAIGHAKYFIAYEQGFFKKENLDVELVEFQNSADGINAVISGKLDTGSFSTPAPLLFYSRGSDIRIVGGIMGQDGSVVIRPDRADKIRSIADLRGKKVATVRLASSDAVLRAALKEAKIDWRSDLEIFELKNPPAVIESVKSGQVDAGVVWGPFDLRAEQQGLKVIVRSGDLYPGHPCCRLIVSGAELKKRPEVVERFLRALLQAERFSQDHRKETVDSIEKYVKLDRATLEKSFYTPNLDQTTDPNVKGVEQFWLALVASNFIDGKRPLDPIFDVKPYRGALESLAKEHPKDAFYQERLKQFKERNL
ncbi:MAG: ABC transporter substrate-binding protein [Candidatus Accumulibacter sp.]|jgi:NitT/TauT family transport system substrate-binding protein|nr:ABC transporter substrate-binding protein [Accumulibacter sp.]